MPHTLQSPAGTARRSVPAAGVPKPGAGILQAALLMVAVLYFARDLFIPVVLAVLLSFVLAPIVRLLRRLRIGQVAAVLVSVTLAFAVLTGLGFVIGRQLALLAGDLPTYRTTIIAKLSSMEFGGGGGVFDRLSAMIRDIEREVAPPKGEAAGRAEGGAPPSPAPGDAGAAPPPPPAEEAPPRPMPVEIHQPPPTPLESFRGVAEPLLAPLALAGIVIVLVVFILLYREDLRDRLIRLAGARDLHRTVGAMDDAATRLSRYFLAQTMLNAAYGTVMAGALWLLGVPGAVLWGIIAGLMRFVPFVGTVIAIAGPVLLAFAVEPGWALVLEVAALIMVSEMLMGHFVEPLVFGHSTGLSPIAVIAAATFWTWLWGPIGLLLSVPLTVCLVVLGRHVQQLEFLEVMLGDRPALQPEEAFYQRALAGDADGLTEQAEQRLRETPLSAYYDEVALKGLALAQTDWSRDALTPDRLEGIRQQVETLLDDLADEEDAVPEPPLVENPAETEGEEHAGAPEAGAIPPDWRAEGAVICIAGRGRLDDLAAAMLAQILEKHGFGARAEPNAALRNANLGQLDAGRVRLCCLSVLEGGSSAASARYFLRRLRRRLPSATILVGLWQAPPESPTLAALRAEQGEERIVTSLREAVVVCQEAAAQAAARQSAPAAEPAPAVEPAGGNAPLPGRRVA